MGLEKVKQEILNKAREEAAVIAQQAKEEAKSIEKSAEKQVKDYESLVEEDLEKSVEIIKRKELAAADLEVQKKSLEAKNELIEAVFSEVRRKLKSFGDKSREAHIKSILGRAMMEMDIAVVRCSSKDVRFVEAASSGGNGNSRLKVVKNDEMLGGLVAESADGKLQVDYSYDAIIEQLKSRVLIDVAKILFGK